MVEYTVVIVILVVALIAKDNVIKQLADAVRNVYASFVYALSVSWL